MRLDVHPSKAREPKGLDWSRIGIRWNQAIGFSARCSPRQKLVPPLLCRYKERVINNESTRSSRSHLHLYTRTCTVRSIIWRYQEQGLPGGSIDSVCTEGKDVNLPYQAGSPMAVRSIPAPQREDWAQSSGLHFVCWSMGVLGP